MRCAGQGSFQKVMSALDDLLRLRAEGRFRGKISIHTVINDRMIGRLYELVDLFESKGIDLVLLCFPWYISDETSRQMDAFVRDKFDWLIDVADGRHSWDAFKYHIAPESVEPLMEELRRINDTPVDDEGSLPAWPGIRRDRVLHPRRGDDGAVRHHLPGAADSGRHHADGKRQRVQILLRIHGREPARSLARRLVAVRALRSNSPDSRRATLPGVLEVQRPLSARAFDAPPYMTGGPSARDRGSQPPVASRSRPYS